MTERPFDRGMGRITSGRIPPRQYQVWCTCGTSFFRDDLLSARADLTQHAAYWNAKATVPHREDRYELVPKESGRE